MSQTETSTRTSPGLWLLFLPFVLAYRPPAVLPTLAFNLHYFVIPAAAVLGARFGLTGVIAVAIGGLAFVVNIPMPGWGTIGGHASLYLVALAVAAMAAASRPAYIAWPEWPRTPFSTAAVAVGTPVLLVLYAFTPSFNMVSATLAYFVFFILGQRGAKLRHLVAGLGLVAVASWFLVYVGLFPARFSTTMVDMLPLQPVAVITALAAFSAGAFFGPAAMHPVARLWRWPYVTGAVLLFVWLGPWDPGISIQWAPKLGLRFFRSDALLPLTAFMLGAAAGRVGVGVVTAMTATLLITAWISFSSSVPFSRAWVLPAEAPFLAYAFGRLGAHVAGSWSEAAPRFMRRVPRAFTAWALAVATTFAIVEGGGTPRVLVGIAFAALFSVAYFFGLRIARGTAGTDREITPHGWLSLLTFVCTLVLIVLYLPDIGSEVLKALAGVVGAITALFATLQESWQTGRTPARAPADSLALLYVALAVFLLLAVIRAVWRFWKDARKVWRETRLMYRYGKYIIATGRRDNPPV